jgi:hypothetical protein
MKGAGKMESKMGKEHIFSKINMNIKEFGKMGNG